MKRGCFNDVLVRFCCGGSVPNSVITESHEGLKNVEMTALVRKQEQANERKKLNIQAAPADAAFLSLDGDEQEAVSVKNRRGRIMGLSSIRWVVVLIFNKLSGLPWLISGIYRSRQNLCPTHGTLHRSNQKATRTAAPGSTLLPLKSR